MGRTGSGVNGVNGGAIADRRLKRKDKTDER